MANTVPGSSNMSFGDSIEAAQGSPADFKGRDRYDGFPAPRGQIRDGDRETAAQPVRPGVNTRTGYTDYKSVMHRAVFVIWRPYTDCKRCMQDIASGTVNLPAEGDHTCPHVQLKAYEEVMNRALDGTYALHDESENVLRDGTVVVSLKWSVPVQPPRPERERQRKPPR